MLEIYGPFVLGTQPSRELRRGSCPMLILGGRGCLDFTASHDRLTSTTMETFLRSSGYFAVFVLMVADSACVPIPSEVTMPLAGALAALGTLSLAAAIVVGTLGSMVGSYIAWAVGLTGGRVLVERLGRYVLLRADDLDKVERWFRKRGEITVLVGRFIPVVRTFVSLPAGMAEMSAVRFGGYTLIGSIIWSTALAVAGFVLGSNWTAISNAFHAATDVVAVIVVLAIAGFFLARFMLRRRQGVALTTSREESEKNS